MMSPYADLAQALQVQEDIDSPDLSDHLTAVIISSVHDEEPLMSLQAIHQTLAIYGAGDVLDPLGVLPRVLSYPSQSASDLLTFMGQQSNAREAMIAIQEAVERLGHDMEEDNSESSELENNGLTPSPALSLSGQLIRLVDLYRRVIPRLEIRRRGPLDTLEPALSSLTDVVSSAVAQADKAEGRDIFRAVSRLTSQAAGWARINSVDKEEEYAACTEILKSLLISTIELYHECIEMSLAQHTFRQYFPRLVFRTPAQEDKVVEEEVVREVKDAAHAVGISEQQISTTPAIASLFLLAHSLPLATPPLSILSSFLGIIVHCIQSNTLLDESLTVLLYCLHGAQAAQPPTTLDPEQAVPLATILPTLASAHPDPPTRHLVFRLLSMTLALCPSVLRLQLLEDLLTDKDATSPQMRVAAIGLVKEAVLDGLSTPPNSSNSSIFASTDVFRALGPVMLRPDPPDLLSPNLSLADFIDTSEPSRLSELLAFLYVVIIRDRDNRTGIRDNQRLANVQKTLLQPLRLLLDRWTQDVSAAHGHDTGTMAIASLETNLERVENALNSVNIGG
ncbi:hypothetical protein OE88DRAFT_1770662 [Heliocybe sulcata]|uniref:Uncharacterized protein n=1 Tax=Heliocybe sulcata TaxID=5364 RepID=A0A5C3MQH9_9AGAM|nr:hypothetical protein OE88DRAFT_1770662 [Heliocybe sulcata]